MRADRACWQRGLVERGQLHDTITVTGRTLHEEAKDAHETVGQPVIRTWADALKATGGLVILRGNLAPEGCVIKVAGHERPVSPRAGAGV